MKKWESIRDFVSSKKYLSIFALFTGLCYNLTTAIIPISFGRFYEFNFNFSSQRLKLLDGLPFINTSNFSYFVLFFIGLISARFLFEYLNRYAIGLLGEHFSRNLREQLFTHQLKISTKIYEDQGTGKYLLRYSGDFKSIQNYLTKGILKFSQDIILIMMLLVVVAYFNSVLALILFGFIVFAYLTIFVLNGILYEASLKKRDTLSGNLSYINTVLTSILTIKAFNKNRPTELKYQKRSKKLYVIGAKYQTITAFIYALVPFFTYGMIAAVMVYLHSEKTYTNPIDQASLLVLILVIITFLPIFRRILSINIVWKLGNISFSKLQNSYNQPVESTLLQDSINLKNRKLILKNAVWKLNSSESFVFKTTIPPKSISFIKADLNSKKTDVFIKLILKIYTTTSGAILMGKHDYTTLTEKTIRKQITVISKLLPLDGRTVFEAISYNTNPDKRKTCQNLLDELQQFVIEEERLHLDTKIGINGQHLNDSQKQLLMWCRTLLTKKQIIVIDKAFLYLNENLKAYLHEKINVLKSKRMFIIIDDATNETLQIDQMINL